METGQKDYTKRINFILNAMFLGAVLLLTVPTLMALFYNISPTWFKVLNTLGWIVATVRIVLSLAISVAAFSVKGESSKEKKKMDKENVILFFLVIVLQLINFMFINFN